ncbi:unnamed protein product [Gongylonema pulchrum]|uniref:Tudor domain-containing protein n=1 Tax=Gongylonema pulchrum TaxID=637853 RepID=A0A183D205_9BILA|nr:unnamed protein product [Gongylonema pulchrum]
MLFASLNTKNIMIARAFDPHFPYIDVKREQLYLVKRSDGDRADENWPLFSVHILDDNLLDFTEQRLDSVDASRPLLKQSLAISYCHKFQAVFRAVITALYDAEVEVHYIDYGNYETVE